jgi:hypothetical protein
MRSHVTTAVGFLIGVLVATAATATAAIVITGANVKNNSLTGADIKNGSLTGSDVKNGSLSANDLNSRSLTKAIRDVAAMSTTGAAGATGATGATGPKGDPGAPGTKGETGAYPTVLASGQTMRGSWGIQDTNSASTTHGYDGVDFPMPLPAGVLAEFVPPSSTTSNCTGTVLEPTAPPGRMCLYIGFSSSPTPSFDVFPPDGGNGTKETGKYGMIVSASSFATSTFAYGSWAVRAP